MNGSQPGTDIDNGDSRKRPLDRESDSGITKRSNPGDNVHFKILVPSIAAGAIIGKGGEAIAQIQKETGAKVKMSKANDFYPGTTERICLILGTVEAITIVHNYIMDRILEKPDPNPRPMGDGRLNVERHKQVKILVPNSTAGMIIGKSGSYIKEIKEKTSAFVQISQKSKEVNLPERCVTVAGEVDQNRSAVSLILAKISEDPQSASCPNISYADVQGPVASAFPTGSPYAMPQTAGVGPSSQPGGHAAHAAAGGPPNAPSLNSSLSSSGGYNVSMESIRGFLRSSGYSEQATEEIANAMYTLANYGFLNISTLGVMPGGPSAALANPPTPVPMAVASPGSSFNLGAPGGSGSASSGPAAHLTPVSAETEFFTASAVGSLDHSSLGPGPPSHMLSMYAAGPQQVFHHQSSAHHDHAAAAAAVAVASAGYPVVSAPHVMGIEQAKSPPAAIVSGTMPTGMGPVPTSLGASGHLPHHHVPSASMGGHPGSGTVSIKKDLEVPESLVGVILGPGGKGIVTLQDQTQTNIQISKKGVYSPGTRNRVVTIQGIPQFVMRAANIINHRLNQEENRRQHQQPPPTLPGNATGGGGPPVPPPQPPPQAQPLASSGGEGSTPSAHESPPHPASP